MLSYPVASGVFERREEFVKELNASTPVRHVVIDDFLDADYARLLYDDLPQPDAMPKSRDYMFSDKRELSTLDRHSELSKKLHEVFMSEPFAQFLGALAGHDVFVDPEYVGGGFHAGAEGSFLDLHVDFNIHPTHENWLREFNILLYLNPGWQAEWGGQLLLTDSPESPTIAVEPKFNRLVIMECTEKSYHGYKQISFPPDRSRRSIAAYGYSLVQAGTIARHTTNWAPQESGAAKRLLAKNWNWIVLTKNKFLGSGTLKNRR